MRHSADKIGSAMLVQPEPCLLKAAFFAEESSWTVPEKWENVDILVFDGKFRKFRLLGAKKTEMPPFSTFYNYKWAKSSDAFPVSSH